MWGLVFRNPGFFGGSGKGSPLTSIEADTNTEILANQIVAKQAQGDSVVDVVQSGNQFYFLLSNHSYIGPVTLPTLTLNPRGAWTALTAYAVNDLVTVGTKVYLVIFAHTSGSTFDPHANDGLGHDYYSLFLDIGSAASPTVQTQTGSTYTLALTDAFTYNRFVNTAGCAVTVPSNSSVPFPVGAEIWLYQAAAGFVTVVETLPVVVNPITGYSNETKCEGAAIKLKKVATDAWDISGLLEPISGH